MDPTTVPWEKAFNYGLPTLLLLIFLWMTYKAASWIGAYFLTPIKDRVVAFLDKLEKAIEHLTKQAEGWHCSYPAGGCQNYLPPHHQPPPNYFGPHRPPESGAK